MNKQVLISGGGIGGLAAALACARAGWRVEVFERSPEFSEFGAGIQMGPNVMHILHDWGLEAALKAVAAYPERLVVRDAITGRVLGILPLGERARQRYGAPYATIARADLLQVLLAAVQPVERVRLHLQRRVQGFADSGARVAADVQGQGTVEGDVLVGADGLWSAVRAQLLGDGAPRVPGHLAYRAMVPQRELPQGLRSQVVTVWLGPAMHVVQYPVRGGEWLNVVAIIEGRREGDLQGWDHGANAAQLQAALAHASAPLRELIAAIGAWRLWVLCDRPPVAGAAQMAQGRVALLGDAAHPTRPYLAQGAGMAIEDAQALGRQLARVGEPVAQRLQRYAQERWPRCARIQAQSTRNGVIFHARGPLRWGRDASMRLLGERVLDLPWLYRYAAGPG